MATNVEITKALMTLAPGAQWNLLSNNYADIQWFSTDIPKPTQEQVDQQITVDKQQAPLDACKKQASTLLYETDWTTIHDVSDPSKSNPFLVNTEAFITYRNALRKLAVNPVADPIWPVKPTAQWGS